MSELENKAMRSMAWVAIEKFGNQTLHFVIGVLLARLLLPSDYGMIGMLAIFNALASVFVDSGFGNALIQKTNRTHDDYSTVFYFNFLISLFVYVLLYMLSSPIAVFYNMPDLRPVARVFFLCLIINALRSIHSVRFRILLNFKLQTKIALISTLTSGLVGLLAAYNGLGVWALVVQTITSSTLSCMLYWITAGWPPFGKFSINSFQSLFSFGSKLLGANIINTLTRNIYSLAIGKYYSSYVLGLYTRAEHFSDLPASMTTSMINKVNYPILVKFQNDDKQLKAVYIKLLRTPIFLLFPVLVMISALSKPLVTLLLGERWVECSPIMTILALGFLFFPLSTTNLNLLYVKGRSDLVLKLEFMKKPMLLFLLGITLPFGIIWVGVGRAFYSLFAFFVNCHYTDKILGYGWKEQIKELLPVFCFSIIAYLVASISLLLSSLPIIQLVLGFSLGSLSYLMCSYLTNDQSLKEIAHVIKNCNLLKNG